MDRAYGLDVGESGLASHLAVGDRFVFLDDRAGREHVVTNDVESHFEYDGRPNKILSKSDMVRRVGEADQGERAERVVKMLRTAVARVEMDGDTSAWMESMANLASTLVAYGIPDAIGSVEKLERLGTAVFSRTRVRRGAALDGLEPRRRKEWRSTVNDALDSLSGSTVTEALLRRLVADTVLEIVSNYEHLRTRDTTIGATRA